MYREYDINLKEEGILFLNFNQIFNDVTDLDLIDKILTLTNNLGYYPSQYTYYYLNDEKKYNWSYEHIKETIGVFLEDIEYLTIRFEKKFDKLDTKRYEELFHITKEINLDKIFKYGLTPKSKNKISNHPERVFLSMTDDINFLHNMFKDIDNTHYVLLSINPIGLKLYKDSNYLHNGLYTYMNIRPENIKLIKKL